MMRIVRKKKITIRNLVVYTGTFDADAYGYVYAYKEWWQRKFRFDIQLYIPYIEQPFYDCERATNMRLSSIEVQLRAEMEQIRDTVERRYNRLVKLHKQ